jgi:hypothetical protein
MCCQCLICISVRQRLSQSQSTLRLSPQIFRLVHCRTVFSVGEFVCSKLLTRNSNLLTRNYGWRDVCNGTTPLLQHRFVQPLGVSLSGFRNLDYLLRNDIVGRVAAINKPKRYRVISWARPMSRIVSGSNLWPLRWDRIGMCISLCQAGVLPVSHHRRLGERRSR